MYHKSLGRSGGKYYIRMRAFLKLVVMVKPVNHKPSGYHILLGLAWSWLASAPIAPQVAWLAISVAPAS